MSQYNISYNVDEKEEIFIYSTNLNNKNNNENYIPISLLESIKNTNLTLKYKNGIDNYKYIDNYITKSSLNNTSLNYNLFWKEEEEENKCSTTLYYEHELKQKKTNKSKDNNTSSSSSSVTSSNIKLDNNNNIINDINYSYIIIKNKIEEDGTIQNKKKGIILVSELIKSILLDDIFTGIYYVFLMSHSLKGMKKNTNITYGTNPILTLLLHNSNKNYDKETSAAAPFWELDIVMGPFLFLKKAIECCDEWVNGTRGKKSKRNRAINILSSKYNVPIYSSQIKLPYSLHDYLNHIDAPKQYIEEASRFASLRT